MGNISWFQFGVFILLITAIYYSLLYYHYYIKAKGKLNSSSTSVLKPTLQKGHDILGATSPLVFQQKSNPQFNEQPKEESATIKKEEPSAPPLPIIENESVEDTDDISNSYINDFEVAPETVELSNSSIDVSGLMFEDNEFELDDLVESFTIPQKDISDEEALIRAERIDKMMEMDSFVNELVKKSQILTNHLQVNFYKSNEQEKWIDLINLKEILGLEKKVLQESELMEC